MQVLNLLGHVFRFSQAKVAGGVQKIFKERSKCGCIGRFVLSGDE